VRLSVNRYAALKTYSHAAQRRPRFASNGTAKPRNASIQNRGCDGRAGVNGNVRSIQGNLQRFSGLLIH